MSKNSRKPINELQSYSDLSDLGRGYLDAALWLLDEETMEEIEEEHHSGEFSPSDNMLERLVPETIRIAEATARGFYADNELILKNVESPNGDYTADERIGHDIYLSQNEYGTGFWDHEELYGPANDHLQKQAERLGEQSLYAGDDGKLYFYSFGPYVTTLDRVREQVTIEPDEGMSIDDLIGDCYLVKPTYVVGRLSEDERQSQRYIPSDRAGQYWWLVDSTEADSLRKWYRDRGLSKQESAELVADQLRADCDMFRRLYSDYYSPCYLSCDCSRLMDRAGIGTTTVSGYLSDDDAKSMVDEFILSEVSAELAVHHIVIIDEPTEADRRKAYIENRLWSIRHNARLDCRR
jgi:hypothetical protein